MNKLWLPVVFLSILLVVGCGRDGSQVAGPDGAADARDTAGVVDAVGAPPIACWDYNEGTGTTAGDGCGEHPGAVNGAAWIPGVCGTALEFDGENDYVAAPSGEWLTLEKGTVVAWVRVHPDETGGRIFSNEAAGWHDGLHLNWGTQLSNNQYINGGIYGGIHSTDGSNHYVEVYVDDVAKGEWHFVAIVWDGDDNTLSIFVDGVMSTVTSPHGGVANTGEPFTVGCWQNTGYMSGFGGWFKGAVDEVKFYDRALTETELNTHFTQGCGSGEIIVDIKPGSCPNPLNPRSRGVLPVAILGTDAFDVSEIDPGSILLEGVAPLRWAVKDVSTPTGGDGCDCSTHGPDGYDDLTLKFDTQEIVAVLGLDVERGDEYILTLTGALFDGTPIEGSDCVIIKGNPRARMSVSRN